MILCNVYREDNECFSAHDIKQALLQHKNQVMTSNRESTQRINVLRSNIFKDGIYAFTRATFDTTKYLKVRFNGEPAVDEGGPRREFFRLFLSDMCQSSGMFHGWPDHVSPVSNSQAVANNKFYICGKIIASMIIQGGQAPNCFSKPIVDFIIYEIVKYSGNLQGVPDK